MDHPDPVYCRGGIRYSSFCDISIVDFEELQATASGMGKTQQTYGQIIQRMDFCHITTERQPLFWINRLVANYANVLLRARTRDSDMGSARKRCLMLETFTDVRVSTLSKGFCTGIMRVCKTLLTRSQYQQTCHFNSIIV
jgi:hypothetical protein